MDRTLIADCVKSVDEKVIIKGWLHNSRIMGSLGFLVLRDRTGLIQIVVDEKKELTKVKTLQPGSILYVSGKVSKTEKTDLGVELINPKIEVINSVEEAWPIEINKPVLKANIDTILDNRALSLRHERNAAIFRIQGTLVQAYREFMIENGFTEFIGPAMLASSSEGGAEVFKLDYFGGEATLAQSNQLYKQIMVGVYERVFGTAKWFRAENSHTRRHLTEGMQYEFEMGFINDFHDVMDKLEDVVRYMIGAIEEKNKVDIELLGVKMLKLSKDRFPRLKFHDAIKIYSERTGEDVTGWDDLSTESERDLCEYAREKYGTDFVFVTNFPKGVFYAYKDEKGVYNNFDLLCRDAEVSSGGQRMHEHDRLVDAIKEKGMDPSAFKEYLSIFKYGMPPHGGFGLGVERFLMMVLGLDNIREASLFPSDPGRVASQPLPKKSVMGAENIKREIKNLFVEAGVEFQVLKHEPTPTSEDSAKVRGLDLGTGVKALLKRDKKTGDNILASIPADKKLDIKKLTEAYQKSSGSNGKLEFEKPEIILERYGLKVGGVPPIGEVFGLKTFVDKSIGDNRISAFNNADQEESLICESSDLLEIMKGIEGDFVI